MNLREFETAVYQRQHERAKGLVFQLLRTIIRGQLPVGPNPSDLPPRHSDAAVTMAVMTRIAAALNALFTDPQLVLTKADLTRLLVVAHAIDQIYLLSHFRSSDAAIEALPGYQAGVPLRKLFRDPQFAMKSLTLLSVNTRLMVDPDDVMWLEPRLRMLVFLRMISAKPVATPEGHARRNALLEAADRLVPVELPLTNDQLVVLSNGLMHCSYATTPQRHRVKRVLNECIRNWLQRFGLHDAELPPTRLRPERPKLAVLAESIHSNHVLFRQFMSWFRQLRQRFELVLITDRPQADSHVRPYFDRVFGFERTDSGEHLRGIVDYVRGERPNLIFYPSVGMRHWAAALANLRLAPIQVNALGHSASSFSRTVDYYVTEEGFVSGPDVFSERVVTLPDNACRFERSPHTRMVLPGVREQPETLRIAIPSNLLKLHPEYLRCLAEIQERCRRRIEIHFFPNVGGFEFAAANVVVRHYLPNATVHGMMGFPDYIDQLNRCDLVLSPFPFGGMHSTIDALGQGIPVVAMDGAEPHARTDSTMYRVAGLPLTTICRTESEYIATAIRLIEDDAARLALSREAVARDLRNTLFGDATTPLGSEVVDAFWWLYHNHEAIQASVQRLFTTVERAAFPG